MIQFVDLTMEFSERVPVFPGDPPAVIERIATIETDGYTVTNLEFVTHFSTHIDAPAHMLADGKTLDQFPIEYFIGEARIVDVRGVREIGLECIEQVGAEPIILFWTGHTQKAFETDFFVNNPMLTWELGHALVERGVRIVGIDSFTPDNEPFAVHQLLLGHDILILENLVNLDLVGKTCKLYIAPLNLKDADGAPARVFAQIESV